MAQAIDLARQGHGAVEPNPMVGCVIVDELQNIVGVGFHEKFGEAHAEVNALTIAREKAVGATAYVTLEPCNHLGKTPPCAKALIQAGISKVVIGAIDPHQSSTGGAQSLRDAGIEVQILEDATCKQLIAPFAHRIETGLPWVTCKWAQTIDGCIETPEGESNWISSPESGVLVHEERGCIDAIIIGVGTVVSDNPTLTARCDSPNRVPVRVVIDPSLRLPLDAAILNDEAPTIVAHEKGVDASTIPCETIALERKGDALDLATLLKHLANHRDATNVTVEGGAKTFQHFLNQGLVNALWVFTSPNKSTMTPKINLNTLTSELQTTRIESKEVGVDTVTWDVVTPKSC